MIDTREVFLRLRAAGLEERLAEAMTYLFRELSQRIHAQGLRRDILHRELRLMEQSLVIKLGACALGLFAWQTVVLLLILR
jgi:hypothetical protein